MDWPWSPAAAQSRTITFAHDGAGRLIGANYGAKAITYGYDKAGNIVTRQVSAGVTNKVYLPVVQRNYQ